MTAEWVERAEQELWTTHLAWLMSKGLPEQRARGVVGMVLKRTQDFTRADWMFRRVKDRDPSRDMIVAFLQQDMKGERR